MNRQAVATRARLAPQDPPQGGGGGAKEEGVGEGAGGGGLSGGGGVEERMGGLEGEGRGVKVSCPLVGAAVAERRRPALELSRPPPPAGAARHGSAPRRRVAGPPAALRQAPAPTRPFSE